MTYKLCAPKATQIREQWKTDDDAGVLPVI